MEIARDNFVMQNLDSVSDVYISGEENVILGMADLFTIPWELAPFSFDNLMHSCEVYDIVMRNSAWLRQSREKLDALTDVDTPQYIDYCKQYKPVKEKYREGKWQKAENGMPTNRDRIRFDFTKFQHCII